MSSTREKLLIIGGPKTGKTTLSIDLSKKLSLSVRHADDYIYLGWSECSAFICQELMKPGREIWEGTSVVRALRKHLQQGGDPKRLELIWLDKPWVELSKGQRGMLRGCETVWAEVKELLAGPLRSV